MPRSNPAKKARAVKARKAPIDTLLAAAAKYIEANGGTALVVGPVQIIRWPADVEYKYTLGICILGRLPKDKKNGQDESN